MFKKRSKKGLSHVDWAMSLAIFLLYLAWFFIFVRPILAPSHSADVLLDILDSGVRETIYQDTSRLKIFVNSTDPSDYEPVIIPFRHSWAEHDIAHTADYFALDNGMMFFLANLSNTSIFQIYYPLDALVRGPPRFLDANYARARSGSFSAHFEDYLLDRVFFMDEQRLRDFSVDVDDTVFSGPGSYTNWTFMGKYQVDGDFVNLSAYVFADNPRVYSFLQSADFRNHSVIMEFTLYNYTDFYVGPMSNGALQYRIMEDCRWYDSDFIDLYGDGSGVAVITDRNVSMRLCTNETDVRLHLEFDVLVGDPAEIHIFAHDGSADDVNHYPLKPVVGVTETVHSISARQVALLNNRDYDYLKQVFGYPRVNNFNIRIDSGVASATAGISPPEIQDVYARKIDGFILDEFYRPQPVNVTLTVW
ncbi:hypothetical protein KY363_02860 [Candidatus Woesearchaeota archaeon]|nr:hypothetical protein [Candidatus Woesearchaeota archaeon]